MLLLDFWMQYEEKGECVAFLPDEEIDNWWQRFSNLRDLCKKLNAENHIVSF